MPTSYISALNYHKIFANEIFKNQQNKECIVIYGKISHLFGKKVVMFEESLPCIFRIEVPLPNNPLKSLNSYLVKGNSRHLLIDTGFNRPECWQALMDALKHLGVHTDQLDVFVTHLHADHCGLASQMATSDKATIWTSAGDAVFINQSVTEAYWDKWFNNMLAHGCEKEMLAKLKSSHPAIIYAPERAIQFAFTKDGDVLHYGNYELHVLGTPGHSPDHLALYIPSEKVLFSGDMILGDITPNISRWEGVKDSLGAYLESLDKLATMDIVCTLPGHRRVVNDTAGRINALKEHHQIRLDAVLEILKAGPMIATEVASKMQWSMRGMTWDEFPPPQKWFATNEALSHLDHLVALQCITQEEHNGKVHFSLL